jgi:hypothetical protein
MRALIARVIGRVIDQPAVVIDDRRATPEERAYLCAVILENVHERVVIERLGHA